LLRVSGFQSALQNQSPERRVIRIVDMTCIPGISIKRFDYSAPEVLHWRYKKRGKLTVRLPPAQVIPQISQTRITDRSPVKRGHQPKGKRHFREMRRPEEDVVARESRDDCCDELAAAAVEERAIFMEYKTGGVV
jgi:hypothetical protein